ncbi:redoxin domain-containing protein [Myroides odoratimimus]|uniref:redoxin family protein n=1 Tax=Myroides odoratimimus TaxID=76832 RepID=UPI0025775264|nr:redoxin family protein [Myroides odoratimimus]MDM1398756.1 redoxin domain-containing protein [Myroides odoratimimus]
MKKLSVLFALVLLMVSCQKKNVIEIMTENLPDNTKVEVYIRSLDFNEPEVVATGDIVGGKAVLDNPFTEGEWTYLSIKESEDVNHIVLFVGEPGTITIRFDKKNPDKSTVEGTPNNKKVQQFMEDTRPISEKMNAFVEKNMARMQELSESATTESDQEELKKLREEYKGFANEFDTTIKKYEAANRDNVFGLIMFVELMNMQEKSLTEYKADFDQYPEALRTSKFGKRVEARIKDLVENEGKEVVQFNIGDKLPEFKGLTPEDKELTLSSFLEGKKLVLVDVWASWCGPCRQENPNVVKTYEEYHKLGFDIIGYSLDKDKVAWVKAIETDKLIWAQVSNLQFWKDPIVEDYGIQGIPANYLIDGNGVIVAMDLRGNELGEKVKELLVK